MAGVWRGRVGGKAGEWEMDGFWCEGEGRMGIFCLYADGPNPTSTLSPLYVDGPNPTGTLSPRPWLQAEQMDELEDTPDAPVSDMM